MNKVICKLEYNIHNNITFENVVQKSLYYSLTNYIKIEEDKIEEINKLLPSNIKLVKLNINDLSGVDIINKYNEKVKDLIKYENEIKNISAYIFK